MQAQWTLDSHLIVTKGFVWENLGLLCLNKIQIGITDTTDIISSKFAVFLAEILTERLEPGACINELNLALAMLGLAVGKHPDIGGNAGVVEEVKRQSNDGLQPVVFNEPAPDVAFPLSGIAGKKR